MGFNEKLWADTRRNSENWKQIKTQNRRGFYSYASGNFVYLADQFRCTKIAVKPGDRLRLTSKVTGAVTAMAITFNASNVYVAHINRGRDSIVDTYVDYEIVIPEGVYYIAFDSSSNQQPVIKKYEKLDYPRLDNSYNYWSGKTAVWFGTSIPAGGTTKYPTYVSDILGLTITNECKGSSMARNGVGGNVTGPDPYGWTGLAWQNVAYSLSATIAEKQDLITNWATWRTILTNSPPATLDASEQSAILDCSFENRLVSRHLGDGKRKDLYIFDHGNNDYLTGSDIDTLPTDNFNRGYYKGAMNYLIKLILTDNPNATIVQIGHYENKVKTLLGDAQQDVCEYWNLPMFKLWEKLGWSQQTITTTGYWNSGEWIADGGSSQTLTMKAIAMADDLHPHTDLTGKANMKIATNISEFLRIVR